MALSNCLYCGHKISELATVCPKCSKERPHSRTVQCPECGVRSTISMSGATCPECGYPDLFSQSIREQSSNVINGHRDASPVTGNQVFVNKKKIPNVGRDPDRYPGWLLAYNRDATRSIVLCAKDKKAYVLDPTLQTLGNIDGIDLHEDSVVFDQRSSTFAVLEREIIRFFDEGAQEIGAQRIMGAVRSGLLGMSDGLVYFEIQRQIKRLFMTKELDYEVMVSSKAGPQNLLLKSAGEFGVSKRSYPFHPPGMLFQDIDYLVSYSGGMPPTALIHDLRTGELSRSISGSWVCVLPFPRGSSRKGYVARILKGTFRSRDFIEIYESGIVRPRDKGTRIVVNPDLTTNYIKLYALAVGKDFFCTLDCGEDFLSIKCLDYQGCILWEHESSERLPYLSLRGFWISEGNLTFFVTSDLALGFDHVGKKFAEIRSKGRNERLDYPSFWPVRPRHNRSNFLVFCLSDFVYRVDFSHAGGRSTCVTRDELVECSSGISKI